jgi:hypothetical protein
MVVLLISHDARVLSLIVAVARDRAAVDNETSSASHIQGAHTVTHSPAPSVHVYEALQSLCISRIIMHIRQVVESLLI